MYYHDHDLKKLGDMKAAAPEDFTAWANLDRIVSRENGKIPRKHREPIAVAVRAHDPVPLLHRGPRERRQEGGGFEGRGRRGRPAGRRAPRRRRRRSRRHGDALLRRGLSAAALKGPHVRPRAAFRAAWERLLRRKKQARNAHFEPFC